MLNWIKRLIVWYKAREEQRRVRRHTEGVMFARAELLTAKTPEEIAERVSHMENAVDGSRLWGTYDEFDEGIETVLSVWRTHGIGAV